MDLQIHQIYIFYWYYFYAIKYILYSSNSLPTYMCKTYKPGLGAGGVIYALTKQLCILEYIIISNLSIVRRHFEMQNLSIRQLTYNSCIHLCFWENTNYLCRQVHFKRLKQAHLIFMLLISILSILSDLTKSWSKPLDLN